jgi:transposase-like protein
MSLSGFTYCVRQRCPRCSQNESLKLVSSLSLPFHLCELQLDQLYYCAYTTDHGAAPLRSCIRAAVAVDGTDANCPKCRAPAAALLDGQTHRNTGWYLCPDCGKSWSVSG